MAAGAGDKLTPFGASLAGAVGGVLANAAVYPLDTIKTRLQVENEPPKQSRDTAGGSKPQAIDRPNAVQLKIPLEVAKGGVPNAGDVARKIWKESGVSGFYRGFFASSLNTFSMQFAYFYWYTIVRRTYVNRFFPSLPGTPNTPPKNLSTAVELMLGALAGALAQIFTIPVSVVATRQQLETASDEHKSLLATALEIVKDDGVAGLWRGLKPSLVLTVNPAITYGMFERFKTMLLGLEGKMTPGKAFGIGALSKTMATVVTYPYIMAKVRLQAKSVVDDEETEDVAAGPSSSSGSGKEVVQKKRKEKYNGALDVLGKVYAKKGLVGWYQGMQAQITKAVLSQALLFYIRDVLEKYTVIFLLYISRIRGVRTGLV